MSKRPPITAPAYSLDAMFAAASKGSHVRIPSSQLLALLAEVNRTQPVVRAALEWHLARMSPVWLAAAVTEYIRQRAEGGADAIEFPLPGVHK